MDNQKISEIVSATRYLAANYGYQDITIQKISEHINFSRASIYNYFQNKEEIYLYILTEEYKQVITDLDTFRDQDITVDKQQFADKLGRILDDHHLMLNIISNNLNDAQAKSRMTYLIQFKKSYVGFMKAFDDCLHKFFPNLTSDNIESINYVFFPFLFGIYPFASVTDKQQEAVRKAGFIYKPHSVYNLVFNNIMSLL